MKNKLIFMILVICLTIAYMPITAFADIETNNISESIDTQEDQSIEDQSIKDQSIDDQSVDKLESSDEAEVEKLMGQIEELSNANINFSSKRLIVKGLKKELSDEPVIANLDGVYLLQYDTYEDAIDAYYRLSEISDSVEFDGPMTIASVGIAGVGGEDVPPMTEEENPFTEIEEAKTDKIRYDVAVIDTGANNADKVVSVLGDEGTDNNGHGQLMIDTIKNYAPNAKVLSIKAIDDNGIGNVSAIYAAIKLAIDEKVKTINLSISALATEDNFIIEEAIKEAEQNGITVIGAAGNNSIDASLTIPGRIDEIIIVGTTNNESNTGDTVDYYIPISSTSLATATVTGLIISDTLKNYEIKDKVIKLNVDDNDGSSYINPSEDFTTQDGSGSSGDNGSPGSGGNPSYSKVRAGKVFVWYDRGGWEEQTQAGAGNIPAQGYFDSAAAGGDGRWYDNTGAHPKKTQSAFYTCDFFINLIGSKSTFDGYPYKWGNGYACGDRHKELRAAMEKACKNAIRANNSANTKARVIGVALTYIKWDNLKWGSSNVWGDCWYIGSYNGSKKFKDMFDAPTDSTGTKGLSSKYGWSDYADPNKVNDANANETWRSYVWRKAKADNAGKEKVGYGYQIWVVAVSDEWPGTTTTKVHIVKKFGASNSTQTQINNIVNGNPLYSIVGIQFKLYPTRNDAKNNTNAEASFTIGANGQSEVREVKKNTTYYLVELGPPRNGVVIPDVLKASNGGKAINTGEGNLTINIEDSAPTGVYTVTYRYANASELPAAVRATLPASHTASAGTNVTGTMPSSMSVTVGDDVYEFKGWDSAEKYADDDLVFVGTWNVAEAPDPPELEDTTRTFSYDYISDDGTDLPDALFDLLPTDNRDEEGQELSFDSGQTVTPATLDKTQVTIDNEVYTFLGWNKLSYTFTDTYEHIIFTGTWHKGEL